MSGPLGFGGGGGGDGNILPAVSGGTGISVSGSGTTSLTVSATGVNSVTAGTGISVSGTTALTVSATGVQSLTAGTGISVSGTTTPTVTNSGVTSIVAGTNVTVSGATGAVTVNAPGFATPGSSAIGDTAAAGTATTVARSDHKHGREAFGTPVNLDASVTSLSAGSLTTVARADHVHTVSKVPVLIASQTLTMATAQVSFLSIPQTFSELNLRIWGRSAAAYALDFVAVRFNNDTGANYYWSDRTGQTTGIIGAVHGSSNGSSIWNAYVDAIIAQYCITTSYGKSFGGTSYVNNSTTATPATGLYQPYGFWTGTAAITRIDLLTSTSATYSIGTKFELYGIP